MVISIHRQGDGFAGSFQVRDGDDATGKREVRGPTCGEVVDALAVVTAIALGADARPPSPVPSSSETPAAFSDTPATRTAPPPPSAPASPLAEDRLRGSTRAFAPRVESVQVHAGTLRFDLQRSTTLYTGASFGVIPSVVLPRYELSQVAAHFITTPEGAQRISGLVLRLRVGLLGEGTYRSPDTRTNASGLSFGIDLCQSPVYDTKGLVVLVCGGFGGGLMRLKTRGLDDVQLQSKGSGFGEASLAAEVQYHLGAGFHIGAKIGGGFTVGQLTAERADGSRIFGSSPWSAYALLGIGFRF